MQQIILQQRTRTIGHHGFRPGQKGKEKLHGREQQKGNPRHVLFLKVQEKVPQKKEW